MMKVVILAGGYGTRLSEETKVKPKPMVKIGEYPIIWHIMKLYSFYGFNDFIICLGYKGDIIKEYFSTYSLYHSDFTINLENSQSIIHQHFSEPWKVTLVDTGKNSSTGGRIQKVQKYIGNEPFLLTYGDGVADINIEKLIQFHEKHGKLATVTASQLEGRFGKLSLDQNLKVEQFQEKVKGDGNWISAGYFVLQPEVFQYIEDENTIFETDSLVNIAKDHQMFAYKHEGFWHPMDNMRDKTYLEDLWNSNNAPWKVWK